jgi:hypothetical protein
MWGDLQRDNFLILYIFAVVSFAVLKRLHFS